MDAPRLTAITDFSNMNAGGQYLRQVVTSPSRFTIRFEKGGSVRRHLLTPSFFSTADGALSFRSTDFDPLGNRLPEVVQTS